MVTPHKRPGPDDVISNNERPTPKKVKGKLASKGKSKAKTNNNIKPVNKKGQDKINR
jgi:hypothetical protein